MRKLSRIFPIIAVIVLLLGVVSVGHAQTPEDLALVANTGQAAGSDLATATDRAAYAQSFTTGSNPDGYFLSSVDVGLAAVSGVTAEVALWWSDRRALAPDGGYRDFPQHILTTLSAPSIDNDASTLERFSTNDVLLLPDTTYWIVVTRTGGDVAGLSVGTTTSGDAVDAGGMAGFSVGNNVWVPDAPRWADYTSSVDATMKIGLRGTEATRPPGPYATNRNEQTYAAAAETSSSVSRYATSFGTSHVPSAAELTSVVLSVAAESGVTPRVAIHADSSGSPAASAVTNGTLTAPTDLSRVLGAPGRAEFTTSAAISLAANTIYWVVLDVGSGSGKLSVSTTASNSNDGASAGTWIIADTMKAYNGSSWSNDSDGRSFRMALNGPTDQVASYFNSRRVQIGLPQVGVEVAAEIAEPCGCGRIKNASWQWQRGETSDGTFTDIPADEGGTSSGYVPAAADLGKWLKALVTYENAFGPNKSVSGVSANPVLSQPIISNAGQIGDLNYELRTGHTSGIVRVAQAFTTGENSSGYSLKALRFGIGLDAEVSALSWALYADNAGEPAAAPLFSEVTVPADNVEVDPYTFEELSHPGLSLEPDTKYWAVLTSSPLMAGTSASIILRGISEWGDHVILDGPVAELDPGSEPDWTIDFSPLALTATEPREWAPYISVLELTGKIVMLMSVLTYPEVTATFGQASYTVAEGATQPVTVTLSADPERTVTIPIEATPQDGAAAADYSVPAGVTFDAGETSKSITFTAAQDTRDDEGESVLLSFGDLPGAVLAGASAATTLSITDDDVPEVNFGHSTYWVSEGGTVSVEVTLTSALTSAVTVPITATPQGDTTAADYSVPSGVTFDAGETSKAFTFTGATDAVEDDGESVLLALGTLPGTVQTGTVNEATVNISDGDAPVGCQAGDLWCATVVYSGSAASNASKPSGRKLLVWGSGGGDMFQFAYKGNTYEVLSVTLGPNPGGGTYVRPPFHIPERSKALLSVFHYRPEERQTRWEVPDEDDLDDWTLYISTGTGDDFVEARLPLDEAKFCCGHSWRWHGLDLYHLNDAWTATKEYRLRIVLDLSADRTSEVLGPPLHLRTPGATRHNALVHWVRPQMRNDAAPPGVSYKVQWKAFNNNWDVPAAVSQHVYQPPAGKETLSFRISGLTPGSAYDVRVIAVNAAGDSAPSNVLRVNTDQPLPDPQNQAANSPATGGPGITGTVRAGETLTATTDGIEDEDGLEGADFSYQWVRQDLATFDDTDIEGATGSTYTVTDADEGKAIKVRVTFTDDAGNEESLTSYARLSAPLLVIPDKEETPESSEAREAEGEQETPLTATIHDAPESHDGQEDFSFELRFSEEPKEDFSYKTLKDHAFTVTGGEVDGARRLVSGSNIRWEITVSPDSNADVTVVLPATTDCEADGAACTDDGRMLSEGLELIVSGPDSQQQAANTPATGEPAISGTARVGETLTADTSGIADEDGLTNVSYSYQWVADDTDIDGATDSSYTLSEDDVGKTINVRVSFEDDAGNEESLTSAATAAAARPSLTASVLNAPQSHNGSDKFTFELRFSEDPKTGFSFVTLKDHAFTVTGGTVKGARRLVSGSNIRWEISVSPDSNGDVTITLPATKDCNADGAICTDDGRMLSERLELTVSGPSG